MLARLKSVILIATEEVSDEEISRMPYDVLQFSCKNAYCEVVQHLIFAGKKKIVFLGRDNYDYYSAVKSALDTNNCLSNDWHWDTSAYPGKPHWENFLDACKDKLDAGIKPDAILTSGDFIAARIIACLKEYDLKVPEDIAVIGLGNSCWGTLCTTALATIDLLEDKMTRQIMSVLLKILDGAKGKAEYAVIPAKFICRKSAG
jgi:LacI family transcriptional regulator